MIRPSRGFTLIELLVAVAIFAALAAMAWGGLDAVLRSRAALTIAQDDFAHTVRSVSTLERDLRAAAPRAVRGNYGEPLPALRGDGDHLELTRLGFAHPQGEQRSNLERVTYEVDGRMLKRGRFAVLDRAADSAPVMTDLRDGVKSLHLRYLDSVGRWVETWPTRDTTQIDALPRAVEFRIDIDGTGEIRRVVELPATLPPNPNGATP